MPVLAERAVEVTARKTRGEYLGAGPEMVEGLFFNWINAKGGNESVEGELRLPVPVKPDPALAAPARDQTTAPGAEAALYAVFL